MESKANINLGIFILLFYSIIKVYNIWITIQKEPVRSPITPSMENPSID